MALRGKSFSIDTGKFDNLISKINALDSRAQHLTELKIRKATDIMWRVAHQKRPMMSKAQMKSEGRRKRVSDPMAEAGVPVQTGALQQSIQKSVESTRHGARGRIWTNIPYGKFVEFGTSRMQARPFMRPAIVLTREAIKAMFAKKET